MSDDNTNDITRLYFQLAHGSIIGHYRNIEKIGAGELGEGYRAENINLDRQMAIKALPDLFGGDAEREPERWR